MSMAAALAVANGEPLPTRRPRAQHVHMHSITRVRSRTPGIPVKPWGATRSPRRPASAQPASQQQPKPRSSPFRPRSARAGPARAPAGTPRAPQVWSYNVRELAELQPQPPAADVRARPQSARPASSGGRHAAVVAQATARPASAHDYRWAAMKQADRARQARADVAAIDNESLMPPFPKFEEQPPPDEMAEIVAEAGVQWARHYAPLSNARMVKRWPRTRHGVSFELAPGVDRNAGDHVKIAAHVGSPKAVTGRAARKASDEPSDTLEHTVNLGGFDAAAAVARRLDRTAVHHGCGYSPGQAVAPVESDYEPTESESNLDEVEPFHGVWKNGHRVHSSKHEDTAARLIQSMLRGKKARARVRGLKIESELGLNGTPEERRRIEKMQARQRGRKVRRQLREEKEQQSAATQIAAMKRGKDARREVETMKIEKSLGLTGDPAEDEAAVRMQALHRSKQARMFVLEMKSKKIEEDLGLTGSEEEAQRIAKLQAMQRGKIARKEQNEQAEAASKIAVVQRGKQSRKVVEGMKIKKELWLTGAPEEAESVAKMQAAQRGKQARREVAQVKAEREEATMKMQAARRGQKDRQKVHGMKLERDLGLTGSPEEAERIAKMQAVQRGKLARKELAQQNDAAVKMQAVTRGNLDRKRLHAENKLKLALPTRRRVPAVISEATYSFVARGPIMCVLEGSEEGDEAEAAVTEADEVAGATEGQPAAQPEPEPEPQPELEHGKADADVQEVDETDVTVNVHSGYTLRELRGLLASGELTGETAVWRDTDSEDATTTLLEVQAQHKHEVVSALQFRLRLRRAHDLLPRETQEPRAYLPTAEGVRQLFLLYAMQLDLTVAQAALAEASTERTAAQAALEETLARKQPVKKKKKKAVAAAEKGLATMRLLVVEAETAITRLKTGGTITAKSFTKALAALELGLSVDELAEVVAVFAVPPAASADGDIIQDGAEETAFAAASAKHPEVMVETEAFLSSVCALDPEAEAFAFAFAEANREPSFAYDPRADTPQPPPTRVVIEVGRCLDTLPKSDLVGDPDPYVSVGFLGTDVYVKTGVISNDRSAPVWNQTIELPFPAMAGAPLRVSIMESDAH